MFPYLMKAPVNAAPPYLIGTPTPALGNQIGLSPKVIVLYTLTWVSVPTNKLDLFLSKYV